MKYSLNQVFGFSIIIVAMFLLGSFVLVNSDLMGQETNKDHKYQAKTENIVREGKIDLKKIDKNKDGKVFQDPMHWNVISDVAGKCPLCKMILKEVSIKEAKENLKKNGFKVK
jgi:hypothetical protein